MGFVRRAPVPFTRFHISQPGKRCLLTLRPARLLACCRRVFIVVRGCIPERNEVQELDAVSCSYRIKGAVVADRGYVADLLITVGAAKRVHVPVAVRDIGLYVRE